MTVLEEVTFHWTLKSYGTIWRKQNNAWWWVYVLCIYIHAQKQSFDEHAETYGILVNVGFRWIAISTCFLKQPILSHWTPKTPLKISTVDKCWTFKC